jgi:hypothetical protein
MLKTLYKLIGINTVTEVINYDFNNYYNNYSIQPAKVQGSVRLSTGRIADNDYINTRKEFIKKSKLLSK